MSGTAAFLQAAENNTHRSFLGGVQEGVGLAPALHGEVREKHPTL